MSVSVDDHPELGASAANRGESAVNLLRSAKQHFLGYVRYMNSTPDNKRKYASVYKDLYGSNNYNQQFLQRLNDHGYDGLTIREKQRVTPKVLDRFAHYLYAVARSLRPSDDNRRLAYKSARKDYGGLARAVQRD